MPHSFFGTANVTTAPFLDLIAGLRYTIAARGADSGGGTLADPYLAMAGPGYFNLAFDDNSGTGRDAQIADYRIAIGGRYMFSVTGSNLATGTYRLDISTGFGTEGRDNVTGTDTDNHIDGLGGRDTISGRGGADRLWGGAGHDWLDGGTGLDWMDGGSGDDTFVVNAAGDAVIERAGEGEDLVMVLGSSLRFYTLPNHVENLNLHGNAMTGIGNALENRIDGSDVLGATLRGVGGDDLLIGSGERDTLDGGEGADRMLGGYGGDVYVVDDAGDSVVEAEIGIVPAGGDEDWYVDEVRASISYTLPTGVENLDLAGSARNGTGNLLDNRIIGTDGANVLRGDAGADVLDGRGGGDLLIGVRGADVFLYEGIGTSGQSDPDRIRATADAPAFARGGNENRTGEGDLIAFTQIDANEAVDGRQGFVSDGGRGGGKLWFETDGTDTLVRANTRAGGGAEIEIRIEDGATRHQDYRLEAVTATESIVVLI